MASCSTASCTLVGTNVTRGTAGTAPRKGRRNASAARRAKPRHVERPESRIESKVAHSRVRMEATTRRRPGPANSNVAPSAQLRSIVVITSANVCATLTRRIDPLRARDRLPKSLRVRVATHRSLPSSRNLEQTASLQSRRARNRARNFSRRAVIRVGSSVTRDPARRARRRFRWCVDAVRQRRLDSAVLLWSTSTGPRSTTPVTVCVGR